MSKKLICLVSLVLAMGLLQTAVGVGPPPNDDCNNAQQIGNVTNLPFDTTNATYDGSGYYITYNNIWYCYRAPCAGDVTVSLCGSSYDTKLVVYLACACYPGLTEFWEISDDYCGSQSEVTFWSPTGIHYLIEIGGYEGESGPGVLTISSDCEVQTPPNDNLQDAQPIGDVTNLSFDTTAATFDGPGLCMNSPNIWYCYTATCTGDVTVSLCDSSFDTMLAVYGGCDYPTPVDLIECNDDFCGQASQVTFAAIQGSQYLIEIGGYNPDTVGQGLLNVACGPSPTPVPNDNCINAQAVGNVTNLAFDNTLATFDGPGYCVIKKNMWYRYTATCTGDLTVSLCGSSFDTKLAVYNGGICYPAEGSMINCNDDFCGLQSEITFQAVAGNQYLIEVGGCTDSDYGQGVLSIICGVGPCPPANDSCYNAQPVSDATVLTFDTSCATFDGPGYYLTSANIWYCYTATCTGQTTVSLCGSSYDTKLVVYNGCVCYPNLGSMIEYNDDFCGQQSEVTFDVTAGNQYLIEVGGYGSATGQGVLSISCVGLAPEGSDLGDAPDSTNNYSVAMTAYPKGGPMGVQAGYPTVYNDGSGVGPYGPIHLNPLAVAHLGKNVTGETEADIGPDQDVVNNITPSSNASDNDGADDGVVFPFNMPHCRWSTFDYTVKVINPGTDLWVNVWCDWNRDGDWNDDSNTDTALSCAKGFVSEWAVQNQYLFNLSAGSHQITTPAFLSWHPQYGSKQIWMRITLSEQPWKGGTGPKKPIGGSGPQAGYEYGETEDYYFLPDMSYSICEDFNGDGVINMQDLSAFTAKWLEDCQ